MDVRTSMDSDFSEVYGSISLKLCTKKVKQIFNIIQNGGLAAIFDVNTLGAKLGEHHLHFVQTWFRVAIFAFFSPFSGLMNLIPPNVLGMGQSDFVHPQTVLQISIPFQRSYIGQQASCFILFYRRKD